MSKWQDLKQSTPSFNFRGVREDGAAAVPMSPGKLHSRLFAIRVQTVMGKKLYWFLNDLY